MNSKIKLSIRAAVSINLLGYLFSVLDMVIIRDLRLAIFFIILMGAIIFL